MLHVNPRPPLYLIRHCRYVLVSATFRYHGTTLVLTCALKMERARKCKHSETYECNSQCKTRSNMAKSMAQLITCFFCDKLEGNVSTASTIQSDTREWEKAKRLQNQKLFTELALGEMTALDARYHNQWRVIGERFSQLVNALIGTISYQRLHCGAYTLPKISLATLQPVEQRETGTNWNGNNIVTIACIHFKFGTLNTLYKLNSKLTKV